MSSSRAGHLAQPSDLVDIAHLVTAYYTGKPDPEDIDQQVAFGTSGHRGSSLNTAFNEDHIVATTQAICDYRKGQGFDGPLFLGRDTHGLSEPAWASAIEVLVAGGVTVLVDAQDRYTPTPAVSHARAMPETIAAMRSDTPSRSKIREPLYCLSTLRLPSLASWIPLVLVRMKSLLSRCDQGAHETLYTGLPTRPAPAGRRLCHVCQLGSLSGKGAPRP